MQENYVDTPEKLADLCARLRTSRRLALDTEFLRDKTYYARLCLLQVASEELIACVDPLALPDLAPLLDLLYDPSILKVMHAARQDLEIFYDLRGALPQPIYDTQLGATLLGHGHQAGYAALVKAEFGVELDKSHTRTDWCRRPLDEAQRHYAADDVRYLLEIHSRQTRQLEQLGRLDWLAADFVVLTDPATFARDPHNAWKRVRGWQTLKGVQLAALAGLAAWREERAIAADKPRGWIVPDEVLLDIARAMPRDAQRLTRIRGLTPGMLGQSAALLEVVATAAQLPHDQWPQPPRHVVLDERQEALTDALMAVVRLRAQQSTISAQTLATRKELEQLVAGARDGELLQGWRRALVGEELLAFLAGQRRLQAGAEGLVVEPFSGDASN